GTANQRMSLNLTDSTIASSGVTIFKPDGTTLVGLPVVFSGAFIEPTVLPVTGTYTIMIDPFGTYTGSITLTLYDVPPDVTGPITAGGPPPPPHPHAPPDSRAEPPADVQRHHGPAGEPHHQCVQRRRHRVHPEPGREHAGLGVRGLLRRIHRHQDPGHHGHVHDPGRPVGHEHRQPDPDP